VARKKRAPTKLSTPEAKAIKANNLKAAREAKAATLL